MPITVRESQFAGARAVGVVPIGRAQPALTATLQLWGARVPCGPRKVQIVFRRRYSGWTVCALRGKSCYAWQRIDYELDWRVAA